MEIRVDAAAAEMDLATACSQNISRYSMPNRRLQRLASHPTTAERLANLASDASRMSYAGWDLEVRISSASGVRWRGIIVLEGKRRIGWDVGRWRTCLWVAVRKRGLSCTTCLCCFGAQLSNPSLRNDRAGKEDRIMPCHSETHPTRDRDFDLFFPLGIMYRTALQESRTIRSMKGESHNFCPDAQPQWAVSPPLLVVDSATGDVRWGIREKVSWRGGLPWGSLHGSGLGGALDVPKRQHHPGFYFQAIKIAAGYRLAIRIPPNSVICWNSSSKPSELTDKNRNILHRAILSPWVPTAAESYRLPVEDSATSDVWIASGKEGRSRGNVAIDAEAMNLGISTRPIIPVRLSMRRFVIEDFPSSLLPDGVSPGGSQIDARGSQICNGPYACRRWVEMGKPGNHHYVCICLRGVDTYLKITKSLAQMWTVIVNVLWIRERWFLIRNSSFPLFESSAFCVQDLPSSPRLVSSCDSHELGSIIIVLYARGGSGLHTLAAASPSDVDWMIAKCSSSILSAWCRRVSARALGGSDIRYCATVASLRETYRPAPSRYGTSHAVATLRETPDRLRRTVYYIEKGWLSLAAGKQVGQMRLKRAGLPSMVLLVSNDTPNFYASRLAMLAWDSVVILESVAPTQMGHRADSTSSYPYGSYVEDVTAVATLMRGFNRVLFQAMNLHFDSCYFRKLTNWTAGDGRCHGALSERVSSFWAVWREGSRQLTALMLIAAKGSSVVQLTFDEAILTLSLEICASEPLFKRKFAFLVDLCDQRAYHFATLNFSAHVRHKYGLHRHYTIGLCLEAQAVSESGSMLFITCFAIQIAAPGGRYDTDAGDLRHRPLPADRVHHIALPGREERDACNFQIFAAPSCLADRLEESYAQALVPFALITAQPSFMTCTLLPEAPLGKGVHHVREVADWETVAYLEQRRLRRTTHDWRFLNGEEQTGIMYNRNFALQGSLWPKQRTPRHIKPGIDKARLPPRRKFVPLHTLEFPSINGGTRPPTLSTTSLRAMLPSLQPGLKQRVAIDTVGHNAHVDIFQLESYSNLSLELISAQPV
ncbi:uncharacterized protein MYCFIDRAFT_177557 [Pseudocercospora fijiensis CIRAD86]|uniref:Uncharacterized protein n=1 Tax=Pseudocercospora fijiensis (strain CIRAD86) TaxID=383855 RepID=M3AT10_PSEFD|nr:uncharacterized protein MYCFIDRAFT_177557 [Pseudocercospora fijiensis CIRAD86]EME80627.1 hypothetical protein MYCFIDRAFT_177557 [Pseudocercospora fijiensis CIRAD86]